jgi:hypothetical protein
VARARVQRHWLVQPARLLFQDREIRHH